MLMKLRLFRVEQGLTISEFADKIGYARRQYSMVERGIAKPTLRLVESISKAFNINLDDARGLTTKN